MAKAYKVVEIEYRANTRQLVGAVRALSTTNRREMRNIARAVRNTRPAWVQMKEGIELAQRALGSMRAAINFVVSAMDDLAETQDLWRQTERAIQANGLALEDNRAAMEQHIETMLRQGGILRNEALLAFNRMADAAAGLGLSFAELIQNTRLLHDVTAAYGRSIDETGRALARIMTGDIEPLKELNIALWQSLKDITSESERGRLALIGLGEATRGAATGVEAHVTAVARMSQAWRDAKESAAQFYIDAATWSHNFIRGQSGAVRALEGMIPPLDQISRDFDFAADSARTYAEELAAVADAQRLLEQAQRDAMPTVMEYIRAQQAVSGWVVGAWLDGPGDDDDDAPRRPRRETAEDIHNDLALQQAIDFQQSLIQIKQETADLVAQIADTAAQHEIDQLRETADKRLEVIAEIKDEAIASAAAEAQASDAAAKGARSGARALVGAILEASGARQAFDALRAIEEGAEALASLAIGDFGGFATHTAAAIAFGNAAGTSVNVGGGARGGGSTGRAPREDAFAATASRLDEQRAGQSQAPIIFQIGNVLDRDETRSLFGELMAERRQLREDL